MLFENQDTDICQELGRGSFYRIFMRRHQFAQPFVVVHIALAARAPCSRFYRDQCLIIMQFPQPFKGAFSV